jgi:hypothetical protein
VLGLRTGLERALRRSDLGAFALVDLGIRYST